MQKPQYSNIDAHGRLYQLTAINAPIQDPQSNCTYEVMGVTRTWRWTKERMDQEIERGRVVQTKSGNVPRQIRYLDEQKGKTLNCIWTDIPALNSQAKQRTGYPTQKPLALYDRIIKASSNEGDMILDSFAGCATTCVAAERLNRQWVGIDIWDKVQEVVVDRLQKEVGVFGKVNYTQELPDRTDDKQKAVPFLPVKYDAAKEPPGRKMTRAEMYEILLSRQGIKCQGCDRVFDDPRYLQLDHNTPRSDGGVNHISNRILLCGPCNQLKSNIYTLSGLRRENKKRGYMAE